MKAAWNCWCLVCH